MRWKREKEWNIKNERSKENKLLIKGKTNEKTKRKMKNEWNRNENTKQKQK